MEEEHHIFHKVSETPRRSLSRTYDGTVFYKPFSFPVRSRDF